MSMARLKNEEKKGKNYTGIWVFFFLMRLTDSGRLKG